MKKITINIKKGTIKGWKIPKAKIGDIIIISKALETEKNLLDETIMIQGKVINAWYDYDQSLNPKNQSSYSWIYQIEKSNNKESNARYLIQNNDEEVWEYEIVMNLTNNKIFTLPEIMTLNEWNS